MPKPAPSPQRVRRVRRAADGPGGFRSRADSPGSGQRKPDPPAHALPLVSRGVRLFVAVSDPTNLQALDEIKFHTGVNTEAVLVEDDKLHSVIDQFLNAHEDDGLGDLDDDDLEGPRHGVRRLGRPTEERCAGGTDDTPIVRFVHKMLLDAIKTGASDIHFEPYENTYRVRFPHGWRAPSRSRPPANLGTRLAARLKVMSELDISERRVPRTAGSR